MFRNTANALNIDGYVFPPKVTGTRFVTHRLKGTKIILHNWTTLVDSFHTAISDRKTQPTVRSKIQGLLKKLEDFRIRCQAAMYHKINGAMKLLTDNMQNGVLPLNEQTLNMLKQKHPEGKNREVRDITKLCGYPRSNVKTRLEQSNLFLASGRFPLQNAIYDNKLPFSRM